MQAYQGICEAIDRTLIDRAVAILQPGADATPVQTCPACRGSLIAHGSESPLNSGHSG